MKVNNLTSGVLTLIIALSVVSCNTKEMENKIASLSAENQKLMEQVQEKDSTVVSFMGALAQVETNLRKIREREMNIEVKNAEDLSPSDLKDQIRKDVEEINRLLAENKKTIRGLSIRLRNSSNENVKLNNMMEQLKNSFAEKITVQENRIESLNDELASREVEIQILNASVEELTEQTEVQQSTINEKTEALNTAYYTMGTYKDLKEKNVLNKEGGFLGLGRTETLKNDFNENEFRKINIRETVFFPIEAKKVELVTTHPEDAYMLEEDETSDNINLIISDPEKFWQSSKYLVLITK